MKSAKRSRTLPDPALAALWRIAQLAFPGWPKVKLPRVPCGSVASLALHPVALGVESGAGCQVNWERSGKQTQERDAFGSVGLSAKVRSRDALL
jgi:hypothetical protein